jgi:ketosteroid isomerase-like protein
MYHFFVRKRIAKILDHLNRGDLAFVVRQFAPEAEHWFSGQHALGGRRRTPGEIAAWYRRLAAVFPGIRFAAQKIISTGPPWKTRVVVEWTDTFPGREDLAGNQGVFVITMRWGRAVEFHVYCDTDGLKQNLAHLASGGVDAAAAAPIGAVAP